MRKFLAITFLALLAACASAQQTMIFKADYSSGTFIIPSRDGGKNAPFIKLMNQMGYDVCAIAYKADTLKDSYSVARAICHTLNQVRSKQFDLGINTASISIGGYGDDCLNAALAVKFLDKADMPNNLFLVNAKGLETKAPGTVFPMAIPPYDPSGCRLFVSADSSESKELRDAAYEYYLTWVGYDGGTSRFVLDNFKNKNAFSAKESLCSEMLALLKQKANPAVKSPNPAEVAVQGYDTDRHNEKAELLKNNKYDVVFIGNSITHNLEKPEYKDVWENYYGNRNAINIGTSAYRTENIVWELENLDFSNQKPKLAIIEIGTNNVDRQNYPYRSTANELGAGIAKIIRMVRQRMPSAKVIVLRCFPGSYEGPNPTSHRLILNRASELVSQVADNENVFYVDINHIFTNIDGSTDQFMLGDWLHPTPNGTEMWFREMEPLVSKILDDNPHGTPQTNTAIIPAPKLEEDCYDWYERHNDVIKVKNQINPQVVLIGNSITHFWGGAPELKFNDGRPNQSAATEAWVKAFGGKTVLNLGFGWDRTQNMLWRLDHNELDAIHPEWVIINAGTNNTSDTPNARINTADEIYEGVKAVVGRVRSKLPSAKIILMAIFPREENPDHPRRVLIRQVNSKLKEFASSYSIPYIDLSTQMLNSKGILSNEICGDYCHPTPRGYMMWANALKNYIK